MPDLDMSSNDHDDLDSHWKSSSDEDYIDQSCAKGQSLYRETPSKHITALTTSER